MKKKVVIIGCGYAGAVTAWRLSSFRDKISVTIIDKGGSFNCLPLMPDCIGRGILTSKLYFPIGSLAKKYGCQFIQEEVISLDLENKIAHCAHINLNYDYLVIATGTETNFYGNNKIRDYAYKLDSPADAQKILDGLWAQDFQNFVISGAGYTGIEVATNLKLHLQKRKISKPVIILERASSILGPLPEWMKDYVASNLKIMSIEIRCGVFIENIEGEDLVLSDKTILKESLLIWAAGVKTPQYLQTLNIPKNPQGRIMVDNYLEFREGCFAAGDSACFSQGKSFLRMAVQFAIAQGHTVALNIARSLENKPKAVFKPRDWGYIIPMANNFACGIVLGRKVKGRKAIFLHYLLCLWRTVGWGNKLSVFRSLILNSRQ
ncbi:MAG: FAD-dependent oxidoreductase [Candidatus Omnitrophica bacterium]|jgi:NADH dehydrogenase|nr:FAD-dependent oxidoreductase [Candidatus Omnitrophota bacterium]